LWRRKVRYGKKVPDGLLEEVNEVEAQYLELAELMRGHPTCDKVGEKQEHRL